MAVAGRTGLIRTQVVLETDDPSRPKITLAIKSRVPVPVECFPKLLDYGAIEPGRHATRQLTVWDGELEGFEIQAVSSNPPIFTFDWQRIDGAVGDRNGTPGWLINVHLRADCVPGRFDGEILVATNSKSRSEVAVGVRGIIESDAEADPKVLSWGRIPLGRYKREEIRIVKKREADIAISAVTSDNPNIRAWVKRPDGESRNDKYDTVVVDLASTNVAGPQRAQVRITTTSSITPELVVPVSVLVDESN